MTSETFMSLLVLAITAAISPFSLVAFSLVLATDRGPKNGIAFILGWIVTVTAIGVVMITIGEGVGATTSNTPGQWLLALELALGTVMVLAFLRRRYRPSNRPKKEKIEKPPPAWQRKLATAGYPFSFVLGGAVQTWPVMIAAGAELAVLNTGTATKIAWMFVFALATTAGIVVLEILALRHPGSAAERLNRIRNYVDNHRDAVVNWLILLGGLWLFFHGLIGLV